MPYIANTQGLELVLGDSALQILSMGDKVAPRSDPDADWERLIWSRHDAGTRWTFHRPSLTLKSDKLVMKMGYRDHHGDQNLLIQLTENELHDMGMENGDEYFPV